jgi:monoamine oxidase
MARTLLFTRVSRALSRARRSVGLSPPPRTALSRRRLLQLSAAGAILAGCSSPVPRPGARPVAIVGAGAAGLTAAFRLQEAGVPATLYEASNRFGGRMFTKRDGFPDGQFCELGGELVDTNHTPLINLARELGVDIQPLIDPADPGEDLYHFGGRLRTPADVLDPATGSGAFRHAAARIAADQEALLDADENWTARARELDAMSLADYLASLRTGRPNAKETDWVVDLLDVAYAGEFGLATSRQSALNMVDFISTDMSAPFAVFGESDEAFRIHGGSSTLTEAIAARLSPAYQPRLERPLAALARDGESIVLTFEGEPEPVIADRVILALPFTRLREVRGIETLGLSAEKLTAVRELAYGTNAKVMTATTTRAWKDKAAGLPAPSNGSLYSDLPFQQIWETSRGQDGAAGLLTNYLAGDAGLSDEASARRALREGLAAISKPLADSLAPDRGAAAMFWARHPQVKGSYSMAAPGQYTTLLEVTGTPELDGRLHFAGEHASVDFLGYMCGAVDSGERAAAAVIEAVGATTRELEPAG